MGRDRKLALAAALRRERTAIARSVAQVVAARDGVRHDPGDELALYGLAALLDTVYTGIEKAILRVLEAHEGRPDGPAWHRALLDAASLDVPMVRPPVVSETSVRQLDPFRGFRHRFRDLYLYDLEVEPILDLADGVEAVVASVDADLERFSGALRDQG